MFLEARRTERKLCSSAESLRLLCLLPMRTRLCASVSSAAVLLRVTDSMPRVQGAAHVSAYVTHGVFPNQTWKRFSRAGNGTGDGFKYFWITDSCATTAAALADHEPFEILSLADPIAAALQI